jgi:hypothetical protein
MQLLISRYHGSKLQTSNREVQMIKLASTTFVVLIVILIRLSLLPATVENRTNLDITAYCLFIWFCLVGSYFAWKLLLIMVRQLGAAIRGK